MANCEIRIRVPHDPTKPTGLCAALKQMSMKPTGLCAAGLLMPLPEVRGLIGGISDQNVRRLADGWWRERERQSMRERLDRMRRRVDAEMRIDIPRADGMSRDIRPTNHPRRRGPQDSGDFNNADRV